MAAAAAAAFKFGVRSLMETGSIDVGNSKLAVGLEPVERLKLGL